MKPKVTPRSPSSVSAFTVYQGHYSVLLAETLALLSQNLPNNQTETSVFIDCTLGEGGHSLALLQHLPAIHLVALDADAVMLKNAQQRLNTYANRTTFFNTWFDTFLANYPTHLAKPRAILMDLGISMFHYAQSGRGFSLKLNEELDMRLKEEGPTAADLVNTLSLDELSHLFHTYGEEKKSYAIAKAIVAYREQNKIATASQLADIIRGCFGGKPLKHHPATRCFQALRIAVNDELGRLQRALVSAWALLPTGGRLAIITFHSLEDRLVKHFMAEQSKACHCPPSQLKCSCGGAWGVLINKGGTIANQQELEENPASRSARLRVIEKKREG